MNTALVDDSTREDAVTVLEEQQSASGAEVSVIELDDATVLIYRE